MSSGVHISDLNSSEASPLASSGLVIFWGILSFVPRVILLRRRSPSQKELPYGEVNRES